MSTTTALPETHAFASKHGFYIRSDDKKTTLIVPGGACNPLYRDAYAAIRNDGHCPLAWSAGQLVAFHNPADTLLSVLR